MRISFDFAPKLFKIEDQKKNTNQTIIKNKNETKTYFDDEVIMDMEAVVNKKI